MQEQDEDEKQFLTQQLAVGQDALLQSQADLAASSSKLREVQQEILSNLEENSKLAAEKDGLVQVQAKLRTDLRNLQVR